MASSSVIVNVFEAPTARDCVPVGEINSRSVGCDTTCTNRVRVSLETYPGLLAVNGRSQNPGVRPEGTVVV